MKTSDFLKLLKKYPIFIENEVMLNEAIKELEDLENRRCENCKHNKKQDNFMIFCDKEMCQDGSKMMWHSFTKDFCCNKWEKEQSENL